MPWEDLSSQSFAAGLFHRAIANHRIHHAYLLTGECEATEAFSSALVRALNCEGERPGDFCGRCPSCLAIQGGRHPDMVIIRPESKSRQILIGQLRELEHAVALKASFARYKVAVIVEADRMNESAQNAFLKTLEEPPQRTVFLLLSEEAEQLKETILSRCLRVQLRPIKKGATKMDEEVDQWLSNFNRPLVDRSDAIFRAYQLAGAVLETLKTIREQQWERIEECFDESEASSFDPVQKERWEEQLEAQAQAEYVRQRKLRLSSILEWYWKKGFPYSVLEILENLSHRLSQNIHESLAWEIAALDLAQFIPVPRADVASHSSS